MTSTVVVHVNVNVVDKDVKVVVDRKNIRLMHIIIILPMRHLMRLHWHPACIITIIIIIFSCHLHLLKHLDDASRIENESVPTIIIMVMPTTTTTTMPSSVMMIGLQVQDWNMNLPPLFICIEMYHHLHMLKHMHNRDRLPLILQIIIIKITITLTIKMLHKMHAKIPNIFVTTTTIIIYSI